MRLVTVVTLVTMKLIIVSVAALLLGAAGPAAGAPQLPPGINAAACPNYPFCGPSPQGAPSAPSVPQVFSLIQMCFDQ